MKQNLASQKNVLQSSKPAQEARHRRPQLYGLSSRPKYFCVRVFIGILLFGWSGDVHKAKATIVPGGAFPEVTVRTFSTGFLDAVINTDMLQNSGTTGGTIKVVVSGEGGPAASLSSNEVSIFAEDYSGNISTVTLPTSSAGLSVQPDVALAITHPSVNVDLYQIAVVFCRGSELWLHVYDLINVGTGSFAISTASPYTRRITTNCNGYPHIDMWADNTVDFRFCADA